MGAKLLPLILLLLGLGAGMGAAMFLADPAPGDGQESVAKEEGAKGGDGDHKADAKAGHAEHGEKDGHSGSSEFVKLNNQFVVPLVTEDRVSSLVVISLSLEVSPGFTEAVYSREPKLRDLFLRVLFDHANMGGFRGSFTQSDTMELLRNGLREAAYREMGSSLLDVLIVDIARQDS